MLAIAATVTAAALTGIFSTTPMAAYAGGGDENETNTDQSVKQKTLEAVLDQLQLWPEPDQDWSRRARV